jgi:hypothetical protein
MKSSSIAICAAILALEAKGPYWEGFKMGWMNFIQTNFSSLIDEVFVCPNSLRTKSEVASQV